MKRASFLAALALVTTALGEPAIVTFQPQIVFGSENVLTMEIGGRTAGPGTPVDNGYDRIVFTSLATPQVTWAGTLGVALINSFVPAAGDSFDLFDFDAARDAGTFATLNLPTLSAGLLWDAATLYLDGSLRIALDPAVTGRVWDGGGADNDWSTDANWSPDAEPLNNGTAALHFAGSARLAPRVDAPWNIASLTFGNSAGAFAISGPGTITVGAGGVTNGDADPQAINAPLALGANASFTAAAGDLSIGNVALAGRTLTITGAAETILGGASGTGVIAKTGAGELTIAGSLGSGGVSLQISAGTTNIATSQTLAALAIGTGAFVPLAPRMAFAPLAIAPAVPEPSSAALFLGGLALFGRGRKR